VTPEYGIVSDVPDGTHVTLADPLNYAHTAASAVVDLNLTTAKAFDPVPVNGSRTVYGYNLATNTDNIYLAATTPGVYTLQFYKDRNDNNLYDSDVDDAAPVLTLTVKDVNSTTSTTSDDLSPVLTVQSTAGVGEVVTANVSTGLTTSDIRGLGGSPSVGVLGTNLANASSITFGGTLPDTGTISFDGTYITETSGAATEGTGTTTFTIGDITRTANTLVTASAVNTVEEDVTNVVGSVKDESGTAARDVFVKAGVGSVTYTATVKDNAATPAPVPNASVRFTLTTGTNSPALTADGTLVSSTATTKVYSAVSNASGVATLVVTSDTTTDGTTYTVIPTSNGKTGELLTAKYQAARAASIENTNTPASLIVLTSASPTLTGSLLDQFGAAYSPSGASPVSVAVRIPAGTVAGYAALSGGNFEYKYTPATTPTAGTQTTFDFLYDNVTGTDPTSTASSINWTDGTPAASVTITAPIAATSVTQQKATVTPAVGTLVTGSLFSATSALLPYTLVTLTGSEGVYFSNVATPTTNTSDDLVTSLETASNASGAFTGYAFFTKAGTATITATSGSTTATAEPATKSVDVTVTQDADPYSVTAGDVAVAPGGTSVVSGSVKNGFGFPVSGATVNLSLGSSTIAALNSTSVTTSADGVWSTVLTGSGSGSGTATLTATLNGQTANKTAHADWLANAGLTIAAGQYQATGTVTVSPYELTLTGPASRAGAGYVTLTGTAKPETTVEILGRPSSSAGGLVLYGTTTSSSSGAFSTSQYIGSTTVFQARTTISGTSTYSSMITVSVTAAKASVTFTAKPIGRGLTRIWINGSPNMTGRTTLYVNGRWVKAWNSNAWGDSYINMKSSKGWKIIKIGFKPTGYTAGWASKRVYVR
jgi:hypothetical protein